MRVCVVEDEQESVDKLKQMLREFCEKEGCDCSIKVFGDGMSFVSDYSPEYDLIFMDIEMPHLNGMNAAKKMRELDSNVSLVFVTHLAQYALKGYEVEAVGYLLKPLEYFSFARHMKRILAKQTYTGEGHNIILKTVNGVIKLQISKLKYVEITGHYLTYHTSEDDFTVYGQISKLEKELPSLYFFRCNKSYVVNFHYVDRMTKDSIIIGDTTILVSRSKIKICRAAFNRFLEGTING